MLISILHPNSCRRSAFVGIETKINMMKDILKIPFQLLLYTIST